MCLVPLVQALALYTRHVLLVAPDLLVEAGAQLPDVVEHGCCWFWVVLGGSGWFLGGGYWIVVWYGVEEC
jgi:hypothetical protein